MKDSGSTDPRGAIMQEKPSLCLSLFAFSAVGIPFAKGHCRKFFMVSVSKIETEGYVRTKLPGPVQVPLHRAGEAQFPVPLTFRGEKEQLASDLQRAHGTAWPTSVANEEPSILTWERILLPRKTNRAQRSPGTCSHLGIQVVGIERNGGTRGLAATYDRLDAGDQLLVLGTQKQITDTAFWLAK